MKVKLISICLLQALNWVSADKIRLAEVTAKDRQTLIEPFMYLGETFDFSILREFLLRLK